MKTPGEIKKGQECCQRISPDCFKCPYAPVNNVDGIGFDCIGNMLDDLRAYTRQLEERNARHESNEKCLASFMQSLSKQVEHLQAERDAAVKGLGVTRDCKVCKHYGCRACDEPCKDCWGGNPFWEWRGVQKEEDEK